MKKRIILVVIFILVVLIIFLSVPSNSEESSKHYEITAHRGFSSKYPENTMQAFIKASDEQVDWIELDVQETLDDTIVVAHDINFKRTANVSKNIWQLTYAEISKINVGHYKGVEAYAPRLEEVIVWAKSKNVHLNIELKNNGHIKKWVGSVVDLINKYNYSDMVLVSSQNYNTLKKIKEYDSNIKTVYVCRKLGSSVDYYIYADIFSMRISEITADIVEEIHRQNKKIYAWVILDREEVLKMCNYDVDNMIVNDIEMVKEALKDC